MPTDSLNTSPLDNTPLDGSPDDGFEQRLAEIAAEIARVIRQSLADPAAILARQRRQLFFTCQFFAVADK